MSNWSKKASQFAFKGIYRMLIHKFDCIFSSVFQLLEINFLFIPVSLYSLSCSSLLNNIVSLT